MSLGGAARDSTASTAGAGQASRRAREDALQQKHLWGQLRCGCASRGPIDQARFFTVMCSQDFFFVEKKYVVKNVPDLLTLFTPVPL